MDVLGLTHKLRLTEFPFSGTGLTWWEMCHQSGWGKIHNIHMFSDSKDFKLYYDFYLMTITCSETS